MRTRPTILYAAVVTSMVLAGVAKANASDSSEKDWEIELAPYAWLAAIDGKVDTARFGNQYFSADLVDIMENLDIGVMGSVSARWGRFVGVVDVAWAQISVDDGIGGGNVRYDLTQGIGWLEVLGGYRVYQRRGGLLGPESASSPRSLDVDLMGGFTYTWTNLDLDLSRDPGAIIPAQEVNVGSEEDWAAPYVAMRIRNDFTDRLEHEIFVGVGGLGAGEAPDVSWQATTLVSYQLTTHVRGLLGYRALGAEKDRVQIINHGPMLGLAYRY